MIYIYPDSHVNPVELSLQRPLPIYELDVNSRDAVCTRGARTNGRVNSHIVLLAGDSNETTDGYLQRREQRCFQRADVLRDCVFTANYRSVRIHHLHSHIDGNAVSSRCSLIIGSNGGEHSFRRRLTRKHVRGDLVPFPRLSFITGGRAFADERNADFKPETLVRRLAFEIPHDGPDSILIFNVIKHAQLARHRDRHVQQPPFFRGPRQSETGSERSHVC